mmetsp:Transcript_1184/g.2566  ORF Transcript_1184/g.2566 Transcript_1184/m.2566 type:complete len:265 (-) Transcript_1184:5209-6003(-)
MNLPILSLGALSPRPNLPLARLLRVLRLDRYDMSSSSPPPPWLLLAKSPISLSSSSSNSAMVVMGMGISSKVASNPPFNFFLEDFFLGLLAEGPPSKSVGILGMAGPRVSIIPAGGPKVSNPSLGPLGLSPACTVCKSSRSETISLSSHLDKCPPRPVVSVLVLLVAFRSEKLASKAAPLIKGSLVDPNPPLLDPNPPKPPLRSLPIKDSSGACCRSTLAAFSRFCLSNSFLRSSTDVPRRSDISCLRLDTDRSLPPCCLSSSS